MNTIRTRPAPSATRCPYCLDGVEAASTRDCLGCRATYHAECLRELGRCGTLGCAGFSTTAERECLRCARPLEEQDLALSCDGCGRLYHRDCYILGMACQDRSCAGTVDFVELRRGAPTCPHELCAFAPAGLGWGFLGDEARRMCRRHAAEARSSSAWSAIGAATFLALLFLVQGIFEGHADLVLSRSGMLFLSVGWSLVAICGLPYALDAWRIGAANPA